MRSVIVTGGSRGIGLGIATTLRAAGFSVVAIARTCSESLSTAIAQNGGANTGSIHFHPFDLSDIAAIPGMVKSLRKEIGSIHALVNNAAIGTGGLLARTRDADIEQLVRLNTISPIVLTKYVVRTMLADAGEGGRIVNVASVVALSGYSGLSVYGATKSSLIGFTRALAREVGPLGITVNAVAPGFADTEMTHGLTERDRERIVRRSALRRLARVEDIAGAVEYLLSDRARHVTGTTLTVDAGATA